jgi:hypothetical protein
MFLERKAEKAHAPLHAKALVLEDSGTLLAIVVVDSCMMPRELIDRAKDMARAKTGIPAERYACVRHAYPFRTCFHGMSGIRRPSGIRGVSTGKIAEAIDRAGGSPRARQGGIGLA